MQNVHVLIHLCVVQIHVKPDQYYISYINLQLIPYSIVRHSYMVFNVFQTDYLTLPAFCF